MSLMALDVGKKKIGVAISKTGLLSSEYCTIKVKNQFPQGQAVVIGEIVFLIKRENIDRLIIGLPKNVDGSDSEQTQYVRDFTEKLKNKLKLYKLNKIKIIFEDEELTSKEAERLLFQLGLSKEKMIERRDQMSAKLILDQYLNHETHNM